MGEIPLAASEGKIMGHIMSIHGTRPDPEKVQFIDKWPVPTTPKELATFFGMEG